MSGEFDNKTDDQGLSGSGADGKDRIVYQSVELLKGQREVWIEHGTEMYRLRLTSSGKLYLTK